MCIKQLRENVSEFRDFMFARSPHQCIQESKQLEKIFFMSIDPTELNSQRGWKQLQQKTTEII